MKRYIMTPDWENEIQYIWESSKNINIFEKRMKLFYNKNLQKLGELWVVQEYIRNKYGVHAPFDF